MARLCVPACLCMCDCMSRCLCACMSRCLSVSTPIRACPRTAPVQGGADHGSGKGPVRMMPGHALCNIASNASMTFTDMLLPIIARNAANGTLSGTLKRVGCMPCSFNISAVFKRRPRVLTQCPPAFARALVRHGEHPCMMELGKAWLLSTSMMCVSWKGSRPRFRTVRSPCSTFKRRLAEVAGGNAFARAWRGNRGPSNASTFLQTVPWDVATPRRGSGCQPGRPQSRCVVATVGH